MYFPPYLSHLPESTQLLSGPYGLHEQYFWMWIHPLTILATIAALIFNRKENKRRKFIVANLCIYAVIITVTAMYFLPGLKAFSESAGNTSVTRAAWYARGQLWQHLSWIRGLCMLVAFQCLLIALTKAPYEERDKQEAAG